MTAINVQGSVFAKAVSNWTSASLWPTESALGENPSLLVMLCQAAPFWVVFLCKVWVLFLCFYVFYHVIVVLKCFCLFIAHKKCFAAELSCWFEDFIFETANGWMCLFVEGCAVLAKVCEHFDDFTSFLGLACDFSHGRWSAWVRRNPPRFLILV